MNTRTATLFGIMLVLLAVLISQHASAAPITITMDSTECWIIQHDGVTQFQATGIAPQSPPFTTINYTGTCGGPPPPDPGAYTTLSVKWVGETGGLAHTVDVTQFANLFGRINFQSPIQPFWAGVSGTNIEYTDTTPKYVRLHWHMPANPGTLPHKLKGTSYGHSPWALRAHVAVVATGGAWPSGTTDTICDKHNIAFDDNSGLPVSPVPSTVNCYVGIEGDYLIDLNGTGGTASWTMN